MRLVRQRDELKQVTKMAEAQRSAAALEASALALRGARLLPHPWAPWPLLQRGRGEAASRGS